MAGKNNKKGRGTGGSVEARRHANSVAKGLRIPLTEADHRQRAQYLDRAERRLAEVTARPPRNAFGIDRNAISMAQSQVDNLRKPLTRDWRPKERSAITREAKDRHLKARLAKRDNEFFDSLAAIRAASKRR